LSEPLVEAEDATAKDRGSTAGPSSGRRKGRRSPG
jgi:hypothetical protein